MVVYYWDRPYEVYGAYAHLGEPYFILWDEKKKKFFYEPVSSCSAELSELGKLYAKMDSEDEEDGEIK